MNDAPSDIDYKDQRLTLEQLRRGERVVATATTGIAGTTPNPASLLATNSTATHRASNNQEVPSDIDYKDQGLTLEEIRQNRSRPEAVEVPSNITTRIKASHWRKFANEVVRIATISRSILATKIKH